MRYSNISETGTTRTVPRRDRSALPKPSPRYTRCPAASALSFLSSSSTSPSSLYANTVITTTKHPIMMDPLSGASKKALPSTVVNTRLAHTATVFVTLDVYSTLSATRMPPAACRHAIPHTSGVHPARRSPPVSTHAIGA